jgi:hypothetical protein
MRRGIKLRFKKLTWPVGQEGPGRLKNGKPWTTIDATTLEHLVYDFVLTYSNE